MNVVGFAGPARVGKSAVTSHLAKVARDAGWRVQIIPFAKPLKYEAERRGFGKEENPDGYRKFCQEYGADKRAEDENYWLNEWRTLVHNEWHRAKEQDCGPLLIIADDVRYDNEHQEISQNGGNLVFLHPGDRVLEEADAEWRTHESEMMANTLIGNEDMRKQLFPYTMFNSKDLVEVEAWAKAYFNMVINFRPPSRSVTAKAVGRACNRAADAIVSTSKIR